MTMTQKLVSCSPGKLRQLAGKFVFATAVVSALYLLPVADSEMSFQTFNSSAFAAEEEGRRAPPEARQSETLGRNVYRRIEKVQEATAIEDYEAAKVELDEIYVMFQEGKLNNRETQVMFQFYADIARNQEDLEGALNYTLQILKIENASNELMVQTWSQAGSYYFALERYEEAIDAFNNYNAIAPEPNDDIYLRLAYAYYSIDRFAETIPPLLKNMELVRAKGEEVPKNTYSLLRAVYLFVEDYPNAYQVIRESIVLFGEPEQWTMLAQLAAQLERFEERTNLYWISGNAKFIQKPGDIETLAQLMLNADYPYGCARVMVEAFENSTFEADDLDNLELTSICYRQAREDRSAVPYLERAAELSDDGENYASLARLYMTIEEHELAIEAFEKAFDKGGIDRKDQNYLFMARAYLELNRFEEGIEAARNAGKDERSEDQARSWVTLLENSKRKYEDSQKTRRELAEYFR